MSEEFEQMEQVTEKKRWTPKAFSTEDIANINAALDMLKNAGFSQETITLLNAVPSWKDENTEVKNENKKSVLSACPNIKEYLNSEAFEKDNSIIRGLGLIGSTMKSIINYYSTHTGRTPKAKMKKVSIQGEFYMVNEAYLATITNDPDRREKLLAHPDTTKIEETIEEF